jgi:hypothetical protein
MAAEATTREVSFITLIPAAYRNIARTTRTVIPHLRDNSLEIQFASA